MRVQSADFDVGAEIAGLTAGRTDIGAIVTFTGIVRADNDGKAIAGMTLEHYPSMTESELARVEAEACKRWPLQASLIVHRVGGCKPGDNIVLVRHCLDASPSGVQAAAVPDGLSQDQCPFWKKEIGADGRGAWVEARASDELAAGRWQLPPGSEG